MESSTDSDCDYEEFMGVYSSREAAIKNAKVVIQTDSRNRRQFEHCIALTIEEVVWTGYCIQEL